MKRTSALMLLCLSASCTTLNVGSVVDTILLKWNAKNVCTFYFDKTFWNGPVELDTSSDDSIRLQAGATRIALTDEQNGALDLDFKLNVDSSGKAELAVNADRGRYLFFYQAPLSLSFRCPSRIGFEIEPPELTSDFILERFKGYHHLSVCADYYDDSYHNQNNIRIETAQGCRINASVRSVTIKILSDTTAFQGITLDSAHTPLCVSVILPEKFSAWLICRLPYEHRGIVIDGDTLSDSTYEGPLHGGQAGSREIFIAADDSITITTGVD